MDAMWSASTIKVIGSGIDDPDFADKLSCLIGDHDVETASASWAKPQKSLSSSSEVSVYFCPSPPRPDVGIAPPMRALILPTPGDLPGGRRRRRAP